MGNYYSEKLNSSKLVEVYQTKIERVKQYFHHEIDFVGSRLTGSEKVLELGAGSWVWTNYERTCPFGWFGGRN